MKNLATRSSGVGALYVIMLIIGLIMLIFGFGFIYMGIMGFVITLVSLFIVIDYFRTPKTPIMLNDDHVIVLENSIKIKPEELIDISYRRSSARGIQYKWGTVIITAKQGIFKYRYLENCEEVSKELTKIMYQKR